MRHLANALGNNIKSIRDDKWIAKCPIHDDKDFAMNITVGNKGGLIMRCHACGATGIDVYKKLNLPFSELYGSGYKRSDKPKPVLTQEERFFKAIFESELERCNVPFEEDLKKYQAIIHMVNSK